MISDDENDYSEVDTDSDEDSLWENPHVQHLSVYPEPFEGYTAGEDIFDFIEKVESAFLYYRVPASSRVVVLQKLVKSHAKSSFSDYASYDDNVMRLKDVFGNPYIIWKNKKDDFLRRLREEGGYWSDSFTPEREQMLWKVSDFLAIAESLAAKFESIKGEVFSYSTIESIMSVLPPKLYYKILEHEATMEISIGTRNSSFTTFKNIQEVLRKEARLEALASPYYDIIAENRRVYKQAREELNQESSVSSKQSYGEISDTETVESQETKNPKIIALRNLLRRRSRISRRVRANKNADEMIKNYLNKSKQVMIKFRDVLSSIEVSRIKTKMDEVENRVKPKKVQNEKEFMQVDHIGEEDLKLPEVPSGSPELGKSELGNLDTKPNPFEDIENRLTKLKFFNQTWFKEVPKTQPLKPAENDFELPAVNSKEEEIAVAPNLDIKEVKSEPVVSTKEETEAFNDWYYAKIAENKIPKKSTPILSCSKSEMMKSAPSKQVVTETSPTVWKVDMNVVIVVMIALLSFLPRIFRTKFVRVPASASPSVIHSPYTVCGKCLCAVTVSGINTGMSDTVLTKHGDSVFRGKLYFWLSEVWLRLKGILSSRGKTELSNVKVIKMKTD